MLRSVGSELAADAVSGTHPEVGGRVVGELGPEAAPIVERMAPDDAAAALRHLEAEDRHEVLERVATDRAGELRQLLSYPPATAGALMSPDPLTAPVGSSADQLRQRLASRPPSIEALGTVFVRRRRGPRGRRRSPHASAGGIERARARAGALGEPTR